MKNLIAVLIALFFWSCTSEDKKSNVVIQDLDKDFPNSEMITPILKDTFNILSSYMCIGVTDSVLWVFDDRGGDCYSIETGDKISKITTVGKANYEILSKIRDMHFLGDYAYIRTLEGLIKKYLKEEVLSNVPLDKRYCEIATSDKFIFLGGNSRELDNGSVLCGNSYIVGCRDPHKERFAIYDGEEVSYFGEDYRSLEFISSSKFKEQEEIHKNKIPYVFRNCNNDKLEDQIQCIKQSLYGEVNVLYTSYGNKVATVSKNGFSIEVVDGEAMQVTNDRFYNRVFVEEDWSNALIDKQIHVRYVSCNDKYIYCLVALGNEAKELKDLKYSEKVYVFDWDLNPVKSFAIPLEMGSKLETPRRNIFNPSWLKSYCCFSDDCKYLYILLNNSGREVEQYLYQCELPM